MKKVKGLSKRRMVFAGIGLITGLGILTACGSNGETVTQTPPAENNTVDNESQSEAEVNADRFNFAPSDFPETPEEFIEQIASMVARYNEFSEAIWPGNALTNKDFIWGHYDYRDRFWYVNADGTIRKEMNAEEATAYGFDEMLFDMPFGISDDGNILFGVMGTPDSSDPERFDTQYGRAPHIEFNILIHELFHEFEQSRWFDEFASDQPGADMSSNQRRYDLEARALRQLLTQQLIEAIIHDDDISYLLTALSTFNYYRENHPEDYAGTWLYERDEGTATWIDVVSGLVATFGDQIENVDEDIRAATRHLAINSERTRWSGQDHGAIAESYTVGFWALQLLDTHVPRSEWQSRFYEEATHPMALLLEAIEAIHDIPEFDEANLPSEETLDQINIRINEVDGGVGLSQDEFIGLLRRYFPQYEIDDLSIESDFFGLLTQTEAETIVSLITGQSFSFDFIEGNFTIGDLGTELSEMFGLDPETTNWLTWEDGQMIIAYLQEQLVD